MISPDDMLARLLYRDAMMLILDKPAGLPVHAGPGGGANLEQGLDILRFGLPRPPVLAHRLDRDTSGCLVLARHRRAAARLGRLFAAGQVAKTYWAVVVGAPPAESGRIELALAKRSAERGWWMKVDPTGQSAITDYQMLGQGVWQGERLSWLALQPRTGRTHQIRVHCAAIGCPLLGDPIYGPRTGTTPPLPLQPRAGATLHLHARTIEVPLYPEKPAITAQAPVPSHLQPALIACGWRD